MRIIFAILGFLTASSAAFASMPASLARQNDRPDHRSSSYPSAQHSRSHSSKDGAQSNP